MAAVAPGLASQDGAGEESLPPQGYQPLRVQVAGMKAPEAQARLPAAACQWQGRGVPPPSAVEKLWPQAQLRTALGL